MDFNRLKTQEVPFPGNGSIPLKLRELFSEVGIEPTAGRRIPWEELPYTLYDKGLYLSGLPASLFFAKDHPSHDEQLARLDVLLKWPFPGVQNALKLLEKACASGSLVMLHRPPGRDVVFEVIREDGSRLDIGRWKAPRPPTSCPKLTPIPLSSPVATTNSFTQASSPTATIPASGPHSNGAVGKPMSPLSPTTPAQKPTARVAIAKTRQEPSVLLKIQPKPLARPKQLSSKVPGSDPFPDSRNVPLKLKEILKQVGAPESKRHPGRILWKALPEFLWSTGRYITGIRAAVILGTMDPTIREIKEVKERPLRPSLPTDEFLKMERALERGEVTIIPRPKERDVVLEVVTDDGTLDIGRWSRVTAEVLDIPEPPSLPKPKSTVARRGAILEYSSDESPTIVKSPSGVEGLSNTVALLPRPNNPPPQQGSHPGSPHGHDSPSDIVMEARDQLEKVDGDSGKRPLVQWQDEVNKVMDQLAEMLVQSGVKLPPNPVRKYAYKIYWADLPELLHEAHVTLAGFPLKLLPYWKAHGRLNGKWVVIWKRETLNHMVDLLENDGIGMEKWAAGSDAVVQALDEETFDEYTFSYDDFVNARIDDPEQIAFNGQIPNPVTFVSHPKRKRPSSLVANEDRAPKRQKTGLDASQPSVVTLASEPEVENSDYDMAPNTSRSMSKEVQTGHDYYKPPHDPDLTVAQLNLKYRRQKEIIKDVISILIYHDIPCIAPNDEGLDFFLPWSNLPRHLAARMVYLAGWPSLCAPVVQDDKIITAFGPHSWDDAQWDALENALHNGAIDVEKAHNKHLFELVDPNGEKQMSNVNFGKLWLDANWGVEADQSVNIFAKDVSIMDPIVVETDAEGDDNEE